jgi:DNA-directed RNA polymerase subunit RPC12/RpoP
MLIKTSQILTEFGFYNCYMNYDLFINKYYLKEIPGTLINKMPINTRKSNLTKRSYSFLKDDLLDSNSCYENLRNKDGINFRKRTFRSKNEFYIFTDEIYFEIDSACMECKGEINIQKICSDFEKIGKELLWAVCPHCESNIILKMNVKIGTELKEYYKEAKVKILY